MKTSIVGAAVAGIFAAALSAGVQAQAWEPTKNV